ncbi:unnamed protein product [Adineta ricciae]|uniref:Uncharacterized protein n=1 Tax=Adineta ricciae TaxID=249248 RepID=A0A814EYN7_ADIRI|nr:unnamed protein product [Adineta ricciae]
MSHGTLILLFFASSAIIVYSRSLSPDQIMPLLFSSSSQNNNHPTSQSPSGQHGLLEVVEHIIRYVATIKSNEEFIDNLIDYRTQVGDKMKILRFLKSCFQITNTIIQREIARLQTSSGVAKKSFISSIFTAEELEKAQLKISNLLDVIEQKMLELKTRPLPPTVPFLSF